MSERRVDPKGTAHGGGTLDVADVTPYLHPMRRNWLDAADELRLPTTDDFNGEHPLGLGCYQVTIRNGVRRSAADAFLRPALRRGNVKLETHAWASKIRIQQRRAIGVDYTRDGAAKFAAAKREVLVCAGTVNSPQLLQLSGIGSAAALSALGIDSVLDNPSVGGHLQDHLAVVYSFKATQPTLNNALHSPLAKLAAGLRYLLGGFLPLSPGDTRPAVQLYFNPVTYSTGDAARKSIEVDGFPGFYLCFQPTRPTSVGRIDIANADFRQAPLIAPNYLSTRKDEEDVIACGRLLQMIAQSKSIRSLIREPIAPDLNSLDGAGILADFRARAMTVYHPVSTCRMGRTPADSVVDSSLRVHGIERLRVIDASVFPTVTSANTNAPTVMVAQKAAALMLAE
jgi:choline dehydrogenase